MIAWLRPVSPHLSRCELTHLARAPIDVEVALRQHARLAEILRELGARVEFAPALPEQPDGVFIEDAAVVLPEVAVIARPGAASRLAEVASVIPLLAKHLPVRCIADPGTLDGGDVLRIGPILYVGESARTNPEGISGLRVIVEPLGYEVRRVAVRGCLHLKTACTFIPPHFLLVNPAWIAPATFGDLVVIPVDEAEPLAANTLTVGGTTLISASFPMTERRLREAGINTRRVEISEFEKAEGGVTCLSLILEPASKLRAEC